MIALARQQVTAGNVTFVAADILTWAPPRRFDTVFLPAGSRACPHPAFRPLLVAAARRADQQRPRPVC
jgi:hypothetical protein